jgi:hypothetical protein
MRRFFETPSLGLHVKQELPTSVGALDLLKFNDYLDLESGPRKKGRGFAPTLSVRDCRQPGGLSGPEGSFNTIIPAMNGWAF